MIPCLVKEKWVSNLHGKPNYACILPVFANDILENSRMYDATLKKFCSFFFFKCIEKIDSMLPWVCTVVDYKRCQNVARTQVIHAAMPRVPLFCSQRI